jgi:TRAP-type mannitol/chloroaromatic compound transport system permease small subunit
MQIIDRITEWVGKTTSWLSLALVLVIVADVLLRYLFSITSAASFELEWHLFAAIFLLGASYALQRDRHVRVDVFYGRFSSTTKAWIDLLGTMFFLLPFCAVAFWESLPFVQSSFAFRETSPDPGGLSARYLIKATIPLGFFLLALQGISMALKSIKTIKGHD